MMVGLECKTGIFAFWKYPLIFRGTRRTSRKNAWGKTRYLIAKKGERVERVEVGAFQWETCDANGLF
jgi:hypothetical protein